MNKIILDLVSHGHEVKLVNYDGYLAYRIPGFYYGAIYILPQWGNIMSVYTKQDGYIGSFTEYKHLVRFNYNTWKKYIHKNMNKYSRPEAKWIQDMINMNLIRLYPNSTTCYMPIA